jgi:hypothetical protein
MLRLAIILSLVGAAVTAQQRLSDAEVARAVQVGADGKHSDLISTCGATPSVLGDAPGDAAGGATTLGSFHSVTGFPGRLYDSGTYAVTVSTNVGRIAWLAADAKRLERTFTLADVGDDLRGPAIVVHVELDEPRPRPTGLAALSADHRDVDHRDLSGRDYDVAAVIHAVELRSRADPSKAQASISFATERVDWGRLLGRTVTGNRATATFDYAAVRSLPPGDLDVVVIALPGERRCKVGRGDREKLFRRSD